MDEQFQAGEIEIDGWRYGVKSDGELFIEPPENEKKEKPGTLFKYYGLNEKSVKVLEDLEIFASNPKLLNDPFDTNAHLITFDHKASAKELLAPQLIEDQHLQAKFEEDWEDLMPLAEFAFQIKLYGEFGILSLTRRPTYNLMWSYYSNHKGFCLELDYDNFPFKFHGPFQMNYRRDFKPISIQNKGRVCLLYQSNVKADEWSQESEWRIIPEKPNMEVLGFEALKDVKGKQSRLFNIDNDVIKKIIFGCEFFDFDNERIDVLSSGHEFRVKCDLKDRILKRVLELNLKTEIIQLEGYNTEFEIVSHPILIEETDKHTYRVIFPNKGS